MKHIQGPNSLNLQVSIEFLMFLIMVTLHLTDVYRHDLCISFKQSFKYMVSIKTLQYYIDKDNNTQSYINFYAK